MSTEETLWPQPARDAGSGPRSSATPSATHIPSIALVRAAQSGDHAAAEALFERYRERLRRAVQARLGKRRTDLEASDVVQATMGRAWNSLGTLQAESEASVEAWFSRVLESALLDHHRRQNALRRGEGAATLSLDETANGVKLGETLARTDSAGLRSVESSELATRAWRLMTAEERVLFKAHVLHAESWDKIASLVGAPSGEAARKRYEALCRRLRGRFGPDSE